MSISFLVTHSGGFHADEVLSTVVLTRLYPEARVVRTRASDWMVPAEDRILYDVGRAYDADQRMFDHHQKPNPLRPDGQPYSSFGLVWHHFGMDYLDRLAVPPQARAEIHAALDAAMVVPIDLLDNGAMAPAIAGPLADLTLPALVESLKPVFDDRAPDADDRAFHQAVDIVRVFVEAAVLRKAAKQRAETVVMDAIKAAGRGRVLDLPMGMPFRAAIEKAAADHLLFVVHPRDDDWALTGIRVGDGTFEQRADLPQAWAGLTDAALEEASGVPGATFCHNGRFIAIAKTREAIVRMAALAVAEHEAGQQP